MKVMYEYSFPVPPGAPSYIKVNKTGPDFAELEWGKPKSDGNSKVTAYHIRMAKGQPDDWTEVTKVKSFDNHYKVKNLEEGVDYFFAVAAENEAGVGKQIETESSVKPSKPKGRSNTCVKN